MFGNVQLVGDPKKVTGYECTDRASQPRYKIQKRIDAELDAQHVKFAVHEMHQPFGKPDM